MAEIKKGDVVRLPSGGPRLTAAGGVDADGVVEVVWFDAAGVLRVGFLDADLLAPACGEAVREHAGRRADAPTT